MPSKTAERIRFPRHINGLRSEVYVDGKPMEADSFWIEFATIHPEIPPEERIATGTVSVFWAYGEAGETGVVSGAPSFGWPIEPAPVEVRYVYRHAEGEYRLFGRLILPRFRITGWGHSISLLEDRDPFSDHVDLRWESEGWDFKRGDEA